MPKEVKNTFHYYKILGLLGINSKKKISTAFRKLAIQYHPKKINFKGNEGEIVFKRFINVCLAFLILNDNQTKELYDNFLKNNTEELFNKIVEHSNNLKGRAIKLAKTEYPEFLNILKYKYELIGAMAYNTAIGLFYDERELQLEKDTNIDPEDLIIKEFSYVLGIIIELSKVCAILILFFGIGYIISLIKS